ncbi:MAG TPA: hypothetical protein EYQ24_12160 [Bacteroidetes bacterium]|nr:hypothetical protein [Bacteroidota bacterium]
MHRGVGPPHRKQPLRVLQLTEAPGRKGDRHEKGEQRRDSIRQFTEAGRDDLAEKEAAELQWVEMYLPKQATDEDIHRTVHEIVQRTGATSMKDMGRVMGEAMSALKGVARGDRVKAVVEALLKAGA